MRYDEKETKHTPSGHRDVLLQWLLRPTFICRSTKRGRRICDARADILEWDIICKLYGSLLPQMLRPRADGSCELSGLVDPSAELQVQGSAELLWEFESEAVS